MVIKRETIITVCLGWEGALGKGKIEVGKGLTVLWFWETGWATPAQMFFQANLPDYKSRMWQLYSNKSEWAFKDTRKLHVSLNCLKSEHLGKLGGTPEPDSCRLRRARKLSCYTKLPRFRLPCNSYVKINRSGTYKKSAPLRLPPLQTLPVLCLLPYLCLYFYLSTYAQYITLIFSSPKTVISVFKRFIFTV